MNRFLIATFFGVLTAGLALFLWQKQIKNYNFSLEKEKEFIKAFNQSTEEYKKNLPSFEIPDDLMKEFEKFQLEKYGTTTPDYAMSTTSEEELKAFFEGL